MTGTRNAIEEAVLTLFTDEDGELHVGQTLTTLLNVVAGVCCQAKYRHPADLATEFGTKLHVAVMSEQPATRLLS